ncbi:MAG: hypothetical protein KME46_06765 [Brasilonema angustatum HA4187-MV1]|nr:hypothetical protein [Brasilonema angustatum HA4187-MV1]
MINKVHPRDGDEENFKTQALEKILIAVYLSLTSSPSRYLARCSLKAKTMKRHAVEAR